MPAVRVVTMGQRQAAASSSVVGKPSAYSGGQTVGLSLGAGLLYKNGLDVTLAYEHEMNYRHAWEFFANGYLQWAECESCKHVCPKSFWQNYRTYGFGVAYKPCVTRGRNHYGSLRIGASGGSDTRKFLVGLHSATSTTMCCGRAGRYTGKSRET